MKLIHSNNGERPADIPKGTPVKIVWRDVVGEKADEPNLPKVVSEYLATSIDYGSIGLVDHDGVVIFHVSVTINKSIGNNHVEFTAYPWGVIDEIWELE